MELLERDQVQCVIEYCVAVYHVICLADVFNANDREGKYLLPIQGFSVYLILFYLYCS